jgi:hypothetical protein
MASTMLGGDVGQVALFEWAYCPTLTPAGAAIRFG